MTSAFSWQNLVFALLHFVFQGQICLLLQVFLGEGNGTPLQYSCLENPMVGRAWWVASAIHQRAPQRLNHLTHDSGVSELPPLLRHHMEEPRLPLLLSAFL